MDFTCDLPGESADGTCGKAAGWFLDGGSYHRPICADHAAAAPSFPIGDIDPAKVPGRKNYERKVPRMAPASPDVYEEEAKQPAAFPVEGNPTYTIPLPSRPPLRQALEDVAVEFCRALKRRLEKL